MTPLPPKRSNAHQRGYDSRWQKASKAFLKKHPLCRMCKEQGYTTAATIVDHKIPHRGDKKLFWDRDNWDPICKLHHDGAKQRQEKSGVVVGCTADGIPLDPNHHWNMSNARPSAEANGT